jgi:hypothetical protein
VAGQRVPRRHGAAHPALGLTGFLLGGVLSATGLYIGAKTGIGIGVGLTSVILAFALFRPAARCAVWPGLHDPREQLHPVDRHGGRLCRHTAVSPVWAPTCWSPACHPPWWQMMVWIFVVSIIGVLLAFPMKRRFINDEQLPFPEGRACGVVLDSLYSGAHGAGMFKARLLGVTGGFTALYQALVSDGWMKLVQFKLLAMDRWAGLKEPWSRCMSAWTTYYYQFAVRRPAGGSPEDPGHRHPPARPAADARRRDAGRRRPDGHRRGHQLPAGRLRQLRGAGAADDPGRRHRTARRCQRQRGPLSTAPRSSTSGPCGGASP